MSSEERCPVCKAETTLKDRENGFCSSCGWELKNFIALTPADKEAYKKRIELARQRKKPSRFSVLGRASHFLAGLDLGLLVLLLDGLWFYFSTPSTQPVDGQAVHYDTAPLDALLATQQQQVEAQKKLLQQLANQQALFVQLEKLLQKKLAETLNPALNEFLDCPECPVMLEIPDMSLAMGKYEVTFEEYDAFAQAMQRDKPDDAGWGRGKHPVINVSWYDAIAYTEWLQEKTGKVYRLPTEQEWEQAARGGTTTEYWWGDAPHVCQKGARNGAKFDDDANCNNTGTEAVGFSFANPFGLYDVYGNVWKWICGAPDFAFLHFCPLQKQDRNAVKTTLVLSI